MPRGEICRGIGDHLVHRRHVLIPFFPVAPILVGDFPLLFRRVLAKLKPFQLLFLAEMKPEFDDYRAPAFQLLLELIDLLIGPLPLLIGGESLDALHHQPPRPGAV